MKKHKHPQKKPYRERFIFFLHYPTAALILAVSLVVGTAAVFWHGENVNQMWIQSGVLKPTAVSNLPYCGKQKMDLYVPPGEEVKPVVIFVHGGGWYTGTKLEKTLGLAKPLAEQGIAIASIDYRLAATDAFPAQIQDLFCSIRSLRSKAKDFNIDPDRIGLFGTSAGAHLVILAANTPKNDEFTKGEYAEYSSTVQAAVSVNGLLNLEAETFTKYSTANMERLLRGSKYDRKAISPMNYVSKDVPPQLIIYSPADKSVKFAQSTQYIAAAKKAGAQVEELRVESADHNLEPSGAASTNPSREALVNAIADFYYKIFYKGYQP